jgi:hypothetical protein
MTHRFLDLSPSFLRFPATGQYRSTDGAAISAAALCLLAKTLAGLFASVVWSAWVFSLGVRGGTLIWT